MLARGELDEGTEDAEPPRTAEAAAYKRPRPARPGREPPPRPVAARLSRAFFHAAARLPPRAAYSLGGFAGGALARLPSRSARVTRRNLELCLPELSARERGALARASLAEAGRMGLEIGRVWLGPTERSLALVREAQGEEHLEAALARGRGVILAAPHLGAWELLGLYLSSRRAMTALYRPPRMREMEELYRRGRERCGGRFVPAGASGVRALHEALRRGDVASLLPDQDPGHGAGIFVPFFGVPANTSVLIPRIARKSGAPVVLGWCERLPAGRGFRVHFAPGSEEIGCGDIERAARALNRGIEACVRTLPRQYLWSYKRFRIRPPGAEDLYRGC